MDHREEHKLDRSGVDVGADRTPSTLHEHETHATTSGSAVAGAVTGGLVGIAGGPVGMAIGAVGGALVGVAAERIMHSESLDDPEGPRPDVNREPDASVAIADGETEAASGCRRVS
jgi:phage tail tape-measure protein